MPDPRSIAERYLDVWNEADGDRRRAALRAEWSDAASYVDPMMRGEGHDGIAAMIEAARGQFPGCVFALDGAPDGHGRHVRFSWRLSNADHILIARGTDFVRLDAQDRIAEVTGFLDADA